MKILGAALEPQFDAVANARLLALYGALIMLGLAKTRATWLESYCSITKREYHD